MKEANELQEQCPTGRIAEFLDSASKEFLDVTNICAFKNCKDVLHAFAEIEQSSSGFTSRKCHWLLVVGHRASLWAKVEAVGDVVRVVFEFVLLVCVLSQLMGIWSTQQ